MNPFAQASKVCVAAGLLIASTAAPAEIVVPVDYGTITAAIAAIENGATEERIIIVEPGTYAESIALSSDLPDGVVLRGRETARTLLSGTVTVTDALAVRISNFTFTGNGRAIQIVGGSVTIANNVFRTSGDDPAVAVTTSQPTIVNNVFYRSSTAIDAGGNTCAVRNNAFVENDDAVITAGAGSVISANAFSATDPVGAGAVAGDPLFVDPARGDFHLRANSPLIDAGTGADILDGTTSDIGAYGGDHAEGIPFAVQNLTVIAIDVTGLETSVTLQWPANRWYLLGGYRLHYDSDGDVPYAGTGADQGDSPIDVGNVTDFIVTGLPSTSGGDLEPPLLAQPEAGDRRLTLHWSSAPGATGYIVHYRVEGASDETAIDVGAATQYVLGGLVNGTNYRIQVSAYAQPGYAFVVTAYADFDDVSQSVFSREVTAATGPKVESGLSNEVLDFPEPIVLFPDLPDEGGCFIATAAFGFYGATEVQHLRRFRDRYLITHAPGRAFVAWYYRHSPRWAAVLQAHPGLKPPVRLALLPAIAIAAFAVQAPPAMKWAVACLCLVLLAAQIRRRVTSAAGAFP